jgi:hypothetical protein
MRNPTRTGRHARWRSHTFADGVHAITVVDRLEPVLAQALRRRVRELIHRGCRRLILDASRAATPDRRERALLAEVLASQPRSCEIVLVVPRRFAVRELLAADVALARSFAEARELLRAGRSPHAANGRPMPAAGLSQLERSALAARQTSRWAAQAAARGD